MVTVTQSEVIHELEIKVLQLISIQVKPLCFYKIFDGFFYVENPNRVSRMAILDKMKDMGAKKL